MPQTSTMRQTLTMNRLWVRLSLAFSGVILLAVILLTLTAAFMTPESGPGRRENLSEAQRRQLVRERLPGVVLGTAAVIGLVGIGAGVWISRSLTSPLRELEEAAQAVGRHNFGRRVQVEGSQELVAVGRAFNQMAAELEEGELLRRNLVADVAHELRTPLSVLQGNLRAMLDDVYPLEKAEVARLYDQTRQLSRLVNDLHDLARAEAHELPLNRAHLDVVALVRNVADLFAPLAEAEEVALRLDLPPQEIRLDADAQRLTQALQNLLINALRHTPAGGLITVSLDAGQGEVAVSVQDTGSGMDAEHLTRVFDRFYRTDRARSRESGGTGLGLAIVRAIVEAHGGTVVAASEGRGRGSTFTVRLPRADGHGGLQDS